MDEDQGSSCAAAYAAVAVVIAGKIGSHCFFFSSTIQKAAGTVTSSKLWGE
jgi:hypothetical protein